MNILIKESQLRFILNEQLQSFQNYVDELVNDPTKFLEKLNTNEDFKKDYINQYNKDSENNFNILEVGKSTYILKQKSLIGDFKDYGVNPPTTKEYPIKNMEEYNNLVKYTYNERKKGRKVTLVIRASLKDVQGGTEFAEAANIALGQKYF